MIVPLAIGIGLLAGGATAFVTNRLFPHRYQLKIPAWTDVALPNIKNAAGGGGGGGGAPSINLEELGKIIASFINQGAAPPPAISAAGTSIYGAPSTPVSGAASSSTPAPVGYPISASATAAAPPAPDPIVYDRASAPPATDPTGILPA